MKTKVINMTPHPINLIDEFNVCYRTIESSGNIRLESSISRIGMIDDIPFTASTKFGDTKDIPKFKHFGTYYISVSQLVLSLAIKDRFVDLLVPSEVVRDEEGNIIVGCRSLSIWLK